MPDDGMMRMSERWKRSISAASIITAAAMTFVGCAAKPQQEPDVRTVSLADFAKPVASSFTTAPDGAVVSAPSEEDRDDETPSTAPAAQPFPLAATGSAPPRRQLKPGDQVIVDSVIGQVAGRPILADAFMASFSDRLRQAALNSDQRQFVQFASQIIGEAVSQEVINDLFLAEAQASLTEQQQMGLLAFMQRLREDVIGRGRGSELLTQTELAEQGMTLDQYLQAERDTTLIKQLISEKVWPRVIVSWKDVEREYQRRYAEFNPPASVTILRIRVPASDVEKVDEVKSRFARGESFAEVSQWIGPGAAGSMGEPFVLGPGGIGEIAVNDAYKQKLAGLSVGQTTEPVEVGGNINWLHVQSVDQPPQLSLYDVQMLLINELRQRRFRDEYRQYIDSLLKRGIYDNMQEMSQRVLQVAMMRYGR
jgi:hypothetical protein